MRIALADAGDGMEDANFEVSVANAAVLRLTKVRQVELYPDWCLLHFQATQGGSWGNAAMVLGCRKCAALLLRGNAAMVQLSRAELALQCHNGAALQELAWMEDTVRAEQQLRDRGVETFADRWKSAKQGFCYVTGSASLLASCRSIVQPQS